MQLSEKEIENFIFADLTTNHGLGLATRGFGTYHTYLTEEGEVYKCKWLRQVDMGPYGRVDVVGYYRIGCVIHVELIEIKANPIEVADFDQILRYKTGISQYFGDRFRMIYHMYLVGNGFNSGHYIHNHIDLSVIEYSYDLHGLEFVTHHGGWQKTNAEKFNMVKSLQNAEAVHGYR